MKPKQTAAARKAAESRAMMLALRAMQRANTELAKTIKLQAEALTGFLKSYDKSFAISSPPTCRVMTDEREWLMEQQDMQELAQEAAQLHPLPNPFLAIGTED